MSTASKLAAMGTDTLVDLVRSTLLAGGLALTVSQAVDCLFLLHCLVGDRFCVTPSLKSVGSFMVILFLCLVRILYSSPLVMLDSGDGCIDSALLSGFFLVLDLLLFSDFLRMAFLLGSVIFDSIFSLRLSHFSAMPSFTLPLWLLRWMARLLSSLLMIRLPSFMTVLLQNLQTFWWLRNE